MAGEDAEELRVEAVVVDYYMSKPLPRDAIKDLLDKDVEFEDPERLYALLPRLAKEIEAASALKQQSRQQSNGHGHAKVVAKMLIVQGTPFYGYHARPKLFVKIFLYNPCGVAAVVQLLESGCVGNRHFQPYEAHVPFQLQVFADYNIEGMNCVAFSNVQFRFPLPVTQDHLHRAILLTNVPADRINGWDKTASTFAGRCAPVSRAPKRWFDRQSSCALEADVAAACILNPKRFESQQKAAEESGELRNVPSLAAIWEEEKLRRIQRGERGTPTMSLSHPRDVDASTCGGSSMSVSPAQSASSLLSQSFMKNKMKEPVDAVLEALEKQVEGQQTNSSSPVCYQPLLAGDVVPCGNSITAESEFSYSQAEDEADGKRDSDQSARDDKAIVDVLLAMQQESDPNHADNKGRGRKDNNGYDTGEDEDISKWSNQNDEIGDILASQCLIEEHIASLAPTSPEKNGWWNVAEREPRPIASPLSELGSPRVVHHTPQKRFHKSSTNTARAIRFRVIPEDLPVVGDIEDLLPPRPQEPIRLTLPEESEPVECFQLSLTPHPQPLQVTPRPPVSLQAAAGNNRLWLSSRKPPSFSEIISSSHTLGVNPMQYQPAFYSIAADIPDKAMVFGGKKFDFTPQHTDNLLTFDTTATRQLLKPLCSGGSNDSTLNTPWLKMSQLKPSDNLHGGGAKRQRLRMPARLPPNATIIVDWMSSSVKSQSIPKTLCKRAQPSASPSGKLSSSTILSNVTILSIEVFAASRGNMLPNPLHDPVNAICYAVEAQEGPTDSKTRERGFIMVKLDDMSKLTPRGVGLCVDSGDLSVSFASDERDLFHSLETLIRRWDPDFLAKSLQSDILSTERPR